jgi:hypothetical protein
MDTHAELTAYAGAEPNAFADTEPLDRVKHVNVPGCLVKYLEAKGITTHTPIATITETFVAGCSDCHNIAEFRTEANTPGYIGRCATDLARQQPAAIC